MLAALTPDMLATDLADYLVRKGVSFQLHLEVWLAALIFQVPFRETHHISGRAVALAEREGTTLSGLSFEQYHSLSDKFSQDVHDVFNFETSVEKRNAVGGPSRAGIQTQVDFIRDTLNSLQ